MMSQQLDKCLSLLKNATSDNERFAALLVVAKGIKADKSDSETRKKIYDAIGFEFINRLLKSGTVPDGCSKYTYKSIALIVLTCFCSDSQLVVHEEMLKNLPTLGRIITSAESNDLDEEAQSLITDSYECLTCIANHPLGIDAIIRYKVISSLCKAVDNISYGWPRANQLLMYIINQRGSDAWNNNSEGLQVLLSKYAKDFREKQDEGKFGICSTLYIILSTTEKSQIDLLENVSWQDEVYESLTGILKSKIGASQRDPALKLTCLIVDLVGIEWLIRDSDDSKKFLVLLVHLSCIEIRMAIEGKTFDEICMKGPLLTSCYTLLENIIAFMTNGPTLALDEKPLKQLHTAMIGAFNSVIVFLQLVKNNHQEDKLEAIVLASVRVLGSWIAEETSALKSEIVELLPFLLDIGKTTFEVYKKNLSKIAQLQEEDADELNLEVLKFLMPGLCHLTAEDKARKVILQHKGHELFARYLTFLWGQMKDEGVSLEKSLAGLKVTDSTQNSNAETGLVTLCGVLLNLIVLEQDLVMTHSMFTELHTFTVQNLPGLAQTDERLVLSSNVMVIGLMLARHLVKKQTFSSDSLEQFFSTCIRLLSRTHYLVKTNDKKTHLALAPQYEPIWDQISELCFLGMQAFSECISLYKQLPILILKSGWLPALLKCLDEVPSTVLSEEMTMSYAGLLHATAKCSKDAKDIISEKRGKDVARKYNMKELESLLKS